MTTTITETEVSTLVLIEKMIKTELAQREKARKADGEPSLRDLIQPGEIVVDADLRVQGTAKVGEDYEQRIVGKAKPWDLLTAALDLANTQLAAAGVTGIDLDTVIKAAEKIDPKKVKAAKKATDAKVAATKAPTLTACKGKVTVSGVSVTL